MAGRTVAFTKSDTGVTTWLFADQVNSTSVTRDQNGAALTQRYTPWGELRTDGNLATDRHFTGQVSDQSTGLAFYNARYYDPAIGRFVSPDTVVGSASNGQEWNLFAYVHNNPIRFSDPSGHVCYDSGPRKGQCYQGADGEHTAMTSEEERLTTQIMVEATPMPDGSMLAPRNVRHEGRIGEMSAEDIINLWRYYRTLSESEFARVIAAPRTPVDLPSLRTLWWVASTGALVACIASTAGICLAVVPGVAAVNVGISAADNDIGNGSSNCQKVDFAIDVLANAIGAGAGPAISSSTTAIRTGQNTVAHVPAMSTEFGRAAYATANAVGIGMSEGTSRADACWLE